MKVATRVCRLCAALPAFSVAISWRLGVVGLMLAPLPAAATVTMPESESRTAAAAAASPIPVGVENPPAAAATEPTFGIVEPPLSNSVTFSARIAGIGTAVVFGSDFAAATTDNPAARADAFGAIVADPVFDQIVVVGIGLIFAAVFLRRRRRRRIGWGVMPDRSSLLTGRAKRKH